MGKIKETSPLIQSDHKEDVNKGKKKKIILIVSIIVVIILGFFIVGSLIFPSVAGYFMEHYINGADLIIEEAELFQQRGKFCDIKIKATLKHYAPIDGEAWSESSVLDVYVQNRTDVNKFEKVGIMSIPGIYVPGKETRYEDVAIAEITDENALHDFISVALISDKVYFLVKGYIKVKASVLFYKNLEATVYIEQTIEVKGFNGIDFTLNYMDLIYGKEDEVSILFDMTIQNPSQIYTSYPLSFYAQDLGIYYNDTWIGHCEPDDLTVGLGNTTNKLLGSLVRNNQNERFIADFLSRYILGEFVFIYVKGTGKLECGFPQTPDYPADIYVSWLLPGIQDELIQELYAPLNEIEYFPRLKIVAEGRMYNPLEFSVELLEVDFDGYVGEPCNQTMGHIHEEFDPPFDFVAKSPVCLRGLILEIPIADATCMLDGGVIRGIILYAQNGSMLMKVELFIIRIPFEYGPMIGNFGKCRD